MKTIEYKTFSFKADKVEDTGRIEGYASTFGNIDQGLDVVLKGAFKKTLRENKGVVPILADHNPYEQIGWNEKAEEDDTGLYVFGNLNMKVAKAVERHALAQQALKLGAPSGLSIGYRTIQSEPDTDQPRVRKLKELKLYEYSFVTFPMNVQSMVTAAKSLGHVDKVKFFLSQLDEQGISVKDLELALQEEAAKKDMDPFKLGQSIDDLILKFKN